MFKVRGENLSWIKIRIQFQCWCQKVKSRTYNVPDDFNLVKTQKIVLGQVALAFSVLFSSHLWHSNIGR